MVVVNDSKKKEEYPFGIVPFQQVLGKEPKWKDWPIGNIDYERDLLLLPYSR